MPSSPVWRSRNTAGRTVRVRRLCGRRAHARGPEPPELDDHAEARAQRAGVAEHDDPLRQVVAGVRPGVVLGAERGRQAQELHHRRFALRSRASGDRLAVDVRPGEIVVAFDERHSAAPVDCLQGLRRTVGEVESRVPERAVFSRADPRHLEQLLLAVDVVSQDLRHQGVAAGVAPRVQDERLRAAPLHLDDQFTELSGGRERADDLREDRVALFAGFEVTAHVPEPSVGNLLTAVRRLQERPPEPRTARCRQDHSRWGSRPRGVLPRLSELD